MSRGATFFGLASFVGCKVGKSRRQRVQKREQKGQPLQKVIAENTCSNESWQWSPKAERQFF